MVIRAYHAGDRERIIAVFERFCDELIALDPERRLRRLPVYSAFITDKTVETVGEHDGAFLVAVDDMTIGGLVVAIVNHQDEQQRLSVVPSLTGRITELYVAPEYRRQGLARRLMRAAEAYLAGQDCDAISVEVFSPNEPARRLYAALGYGERDVDLFKRLPARDESAGAERGALGLGATAKAIAGSGDQSLVEAGYDRMGEAYLAAKDAGARVAAAPAIDLAHEADVPSVCELDTRVLGRAARSRLLQDAIRAKHCWVARGPSGLKGFAVFAPSFFSEWFIELLIVDPVWRRHGIGSALVRQCAATCPGSKIFTSTNASNAPMQCLLATQGFERSGIVENLDEGDPELIYVKWLSSGRAGR